MEKKEEPKKEIRRIVRIAGKDLDGRRTVERALWYVKGISHMSAHAIRVVLSFPESLKLGELNEEQLNKLKDALQNPLKYKIPAWLLNRRKDIGTGKDLHILGSDLDIVKRFDVKRLQSVKSYRGLRHAWGLKVRGQRTKSTGRKGAAIGVRKKRKGARAGGGGKK